MGGFLLFAAITKEAQQMKQLVVFVIAALVCACAWQPASAQSWNIQIVDDGGDTGYGSRVGAASDGTPYILYHGYSGWIKLAWWISTGVETGGWDRITLSQRDIYHNTMDLEVDGADGIHVVMTNSAGGNKMYYGVFDHATKTWSLPLEQVGTDYGNLSLALRDSLGTIIPSIAYAKPGTPYSLYVTTRDPGSGIWYPQMVYDDYSTGRPSIAVDSAGKLHVSYQERAGYNLMYATNSSGIWVSEYVDIAGIVGTYSAIVIDSGDVPYIVYYDDTNRDLKYAKLDNS
jgi:hypothetical protein